MNRSEFLKTLALLPIMDATLSLRELVAQTSSLPPSEKMPALFVGHGNPMNAIWDNSFTQKLAQIGASLPHAQAILVVSAHWETAGTCVSVNPHPNTIYDFGGFPDELYRIVYPAPGAPEFAHDLSTSVKTKTVKEDATMGLDHGAWTILKHMYPKAQVPVFQVSLDYTMSAQAHYNLARELAYLRHRGVIIIGSGNIVHNLRRVVFDDVNAKAFEWAHEFDETVKAHILKRDFKSLIEYEKLGHSAQLAVPSNEHYLPMLYALALSEEKEDIKMIYEGMQNGSISMRCFQVG